MAQLTCIPALDDNYIWLLNANSQAIIVDPGDAEPVLQQLQQTSATPLAILLTHHHNDHIDGVKQLLKTYPQLVVYGPQETADKGAHKIVQEGDIIKLAELEFQVIALPGHTLGHIAYYSKPYLFCGDTLFSAGCGRIFEGTAEQMFNSIEKIRVLADDTLICCAHEYTLSNLRFAQSIQPENAYINDYLLKVEALRAKQQPSVPTLLSTEKSINLFLQSADPQLQNKLGITPSKTASLKTFTQLRLKKDNT